MGYAASTGIGDRAALDKLSYGTDARGELCSVGAAPPELQDWAKKEYLWYSGDMGVSICVEKCPQRGDSVTWYLDTPHRAVAAEYSSHADLRRCISPHPVPQSVPSSIRDVVAAIPATEGIDDPLFRGAADLEEGWVWVVVGVGVAGVLSVVLLQLVSKSGGMAAGFGTAVAAALLLAVGAAACITHSCDVGGGCMGGDANDSDESADWTAWFAAGVALGVCSLVMLSDVMIARSPTQAVEQLLADAAAAVSQQPALLGLAVGAVVWVLAVTVFSCMAGAGLVAQGKYQRLLVSADSSPADDSPLEDGQAGFVSRKGKWEADTTASGLVFLILIGWFVLCGVCSAVARTASAYATACWYLETQASMCGLGKALTWAGSCVVCAVLQLPLQLLSPLLRLQLSRGNRSPLLAYSPFALAVAAADDVLEMVPTGNPAVCGFIGAGGEVANLWPPARTVIGTLRGKAHADSLLAASSITCGAVGGLLAWQLLRDEAMAPRVGAAAVPIAVAAAGAFMCAAAVLNIFGGAVDVLVVLRARGKRGVTAALHPPPAPDGVRTLTATVFAEGQKAPASFVRVEGSQETSDCGSVKVGHFRVYAEEPGADSSGAGATRWEVLKLPGAKGTWVRPFGRETEGTPSDVSQGRVLAHFWAQSVDVGGAHPPGTVLVLHRGGAQGGERSTFVSSMWMPAVEPPWRVIHAFRSAAAAAPAEDTRRATVPVAATPTAEAVLAAPSVWALGQGKGVGRYPLRRGCRVVLYQGACVGAVEASLLPVDVFQQQPPDGAAKKHHAQPGPPWAADDDSAGPRKYVRRNCWEEVFHSFLTAKHFIYVSGADFSPATRLLRERTVEVPGYPQCLRTDISVGEVLKLKSEEGVSVCLLVSQGSPHAAVCQEYFKGTKVNCCLAPMQTAVADGIFGNHQGTIVVDQPQLVPAQGEQRRAVAFVGGLDLTKGRYDTPAKPLFASDFLAAGDFYQSCAQDVRQEEGPRLPWQDVHAKLEGEVALDVLDSFKTRWCKCADGRALFSRDDDLAAADTLFSGPHPEQWHCQIYRSTDKNADGSSWKGLWAEGVERDVEHALVHAIHAAEHFVYIETRQFAGSCAKASVDMGKIRPLAWPGWEYDAPRVGKGTLFKKPRRKASTNTVPQELTARIARAIAQGKDFVAYVCVSMMPEGEPSDEAVQEKLHWQFQTMLAAYKTIKDCLTKAGSNRRPDEYLVFVCLGSREPGHTGVPQEEAQTRRGRLLTSRRMMINVNSHLLIADDEYVLAGTAAINDRSLSGDRDVETCFGAYQPAYGRETGGQPRGTVHGFRMSLWDEHLTMPAEASFDFREPGTRACADNVRKQVQGAWSDYLAPPPQTPLRSRFLAHPTAAAALAVCDGRPAAEITDTFPDTDTLVIGAVGSLDWGSA
eukprot:TRINITY_DN1769_c0_g1_i1.p1 TRINITY_DN1769_c0_g1~~TRINITY_DN1769_c0_g1_i1.p1  ORF type:complete len:1510 (+),score=499.07 TRINITY_DN1769_c0_g1_i1:328-4530(+)